MQFPSQEPADLKIRMKILVAIASYGTGNDGYLSRLVQEYRSMSYDVHIVVLSNEPKDEALGVETRVVDLKGKNPWSLPFPHKQLFADRLNDYDMFVYSEDDTLVTEKNLRSFQEISAALPNEEIPGFLRFEECPDGRRNFPEVHGHFHWDPTSVRRRGEHTLAFFTNEHAACYVLTRPQLRRAIESGGFLVGPHSDKYDLLCTAATDPYTQCGFQKLICISRVEDFLIYHLPNKYVGTSFGVDDEELRRQICVLMRIGSNGHRPESLFQTETKLKDGWYSKNYYEPVHPAMLSAIPGNARSVLSIGCGCGTMEKALVEKGMRVVAVPLDAVIAPGVGTEALQIVTENFRTAREVLKDRQFDCLLLSNVLHLVEDPVEILSAFGPLLSENGVSVALVPNLRRLPAYWKRISENNSSGNFESTGVHVTSDKILRSWFESAGMKVESVVHILPPRAEAARRLSLGLMKQLLSSELVAVAHKH
jgi:2-polyprenyl-3-methyl-5-hydroxy-6-metoxy-1,4-benzoquinol methylase